MCGIYPHKATPAVVHMDQLTNEDWFMRAHESVSTRWRTADSHMRAGLIQIAADTDEAVSMGLAVGPFMHASELGTRHPMGWRWTGRGCRSPPHRPHLPLNGSHSPCLRRSSH